MEELELALPADMELQEEPEATAYGFNPTTGLCTKEASGAEFYAESTNYPNPERDSDGYVDLYNAEGEHVASYIDGEVVPVSDDEEDEEA